MNRNLAITMLAIAALLTSGAARAETNPPLDAARAALKAGDLPKAAALLEPLAGPESKDAPALIALSQVRLAQKKSVEAVALAERATKLDATRADYFDQLGYALGQRINEVSFIQKAGLSGKLRRAFAKAVELNPNDVGGLIGLTRFYANAPAIAGGDLDKAREFATRVRAIDAFLGEVELGFVAEQDEKFDEALGHYEAAAKLRPGSAGVTANCGRMLAKLGRKDEARAKFEAALGIDPGHAGAKKGIEELDAKKG